ncbi:MAG TPA: hypothetical protein VMD08_17775 [Candidatus Baltobacteraceae bacterium]|nr:hypothetical protein [Candidatus Baltobacteraceae bacterium]
MQQLNEPDSEGRTTSDSSAQAWMRQWRNAGVALAAIRRDELIHLSDERALAASEALLSLATLFQLNPQREAWSGLVEQQALFHRRIVK